MSRRDRPHGQSPGPSSKARARRRGATHSLSLGLAREYGIPLAALAAAGVAVSLYLTYVRRLVLAGGDGGGLCTIGASLDCGAVLASRYAAVAGVPLSTLALWFYALTGIVALWGLRRNPGPLPRSPASVLFVAYGVAAGMSVVLAGISVAFIGSFCPLCAALYTLNVAGLLLGWRAIRSTGEGVRDALDAERVRWQAQRKRAVRYSASALVPLVLAFVIASISSRKVDVCQAVAAAARERRAVEMVVFSDFQCPHCQDLHRALRPVRQNRLVRLVFRHYPLAAECNPAVQRAGRPGTCLQARASICANVQGRAVDFDDRLFDGGPVDVAGLVALARSMGVDASRFGVCLQSDETSRALRRDVDDAIATNVRATPAIFLDGRRLETVPTSADIACLLRIDGSR